MPPHKSKEFDPAVVQGMQEPITATVFKLVGNNQNPVPLPSKEGLQPGAGLTRDDIMKIATGDIVKIAAQQQGYGDGGGIYRVNLVDSVSAQHRFELSYPINVPPPWQPPSGQGYNGWPPPAPAPPPAWQGSAGYGPGLGYVQYPGTYALPSSYASWQPNMGSPWQPNYGASYTPQPPWAWSPPPSSSSPSNSEQQLRDTIAAQERARLEDKYIAERHAQETRHAQELAALREEIRRSGETRPAGPSPEFVAMQATVTHLQQELREAKSDVNRARDEANHRAEMQRLESKLDLMAAQPKTDPMASIIPVIQAQATQSADTAKAIAMSGKDTTDLIMKTMMNPLQMVEMMKALMSKPDEQLKFVDGLMGMYQKTFELLSQGGGGSPIADAITASMAQIGDAVKAYYKRGGVEASAQAQIASAQAAAMQAQAMMATGGRPGFASPPPVVQLPAGGASSTSGEVTTPAQPVAEAKPAEAVKPVDAKPAEQKLPEGVRPPTEEDIKLFGPELAPEVMKFRAHVAGRYVDPETSRVVSQPSPEEAADIIEQAAGAAAQIAKSRGILITVAAPAFAWYNEREMERLTAAILPDAPQAFVDELTEELIDAVSEDDDDDEDAGERAPAPAA